MFYLFLWQLLVLVMIWNIISVNLLNNLQGGKHDKKKAKLSKQEKKILSNYEALRGIKENTILSGGIAKKRKASLDDYDNKVMKITLMT